VFIFLSLRCANIASVEFGGINPVLSYFMYSLFVLIFTLFQFSLPAFIAQRFFKNSPLAYGFFYTLFELLRSHFPFGGFPWLLMGEVISQVPLLKYSSVLFEHTPLHLLALGFGNFPVPKKAFLFALILLVLLSLSLSAYFVPPKKLNGVKVALVQTAVPQEDKLSKEAFDRHTPQILQMVEKALEEKPDLVVLPESALPFYFSEEQTEIFYHLSLKGPILVGLIDVRENLKPFNSAYLFAEGMLIDYYDKVKLMPIGEYVPKPFGFLKEIFQAIGGIDYVPGQSAKVIKYKDLRIAVPICFEVAHYSYMERLAKDANLIVVLTNDGWFKDSDCTFQHFRFAQWASLRFKTYTLWVNNSGDTAIIDPYGRVLKKLGYMERDVLVEVLR
jgi:apolipoprotein N-acyltransferase